MLEVSWCLEEQESDTFVNYNNIFEIILREKDYHNINTYTHSVTYTTHTYTFGYN